MENDFCMQSISNSTEMREFGYAISLEKICFQLFIVTQIKMLKIVKMLII